MCVVLEVGNLIHLVDSFKAHLIPSPSQVPQKWFVDHCTSASEPRQDLGTRMPPNRLVTTPDTIGR
jgi:hypothetical protein